MGSGLNADSLAKLARSTPEHVRSLTALGLLDPVDGEYAPGDVHRIRLVDAFATAGVPVEALARASAQGTATLAYYDQLHQVPGTPSARSYGQLLADLGDRAGDLRHIFDSCGIAEPAADDRLDEGEQHLLLAVLEALEANRDPDLALRALHVLGDAARRGSEAAMSVYSEAVERAAADIAGLPPTETYQRFLEPWARFARLVPELGAWLHARHLSAAIDTWSVAETERQLAASGIVPERQVEPPAIAFIDLTGFTLLTEESGDREAATVAMTFSSLAAKVAEDGGGRLVKPLGDGVLLRFATARAAAEAALEVLERLGPAGLPTGHAGIASGPVIVREGDVFGRTVNLAARISDRAQPGQLLSTSTLASAVSGEGLGYEPVGRVSLQGIPGPVELARIWRRDTPR
ncbi:MAG: adenylate/guanylate cyclase domain-containing protein [Candidatus Limnocylindrales bacterium]